MFKASLETKYSISPWTLAGHSSLTHFISTKPSSLSSLWLHTGQLTGSSMIFSFPVLSSFIDFTTCGIISAAFSIKTLSPILISFLWISLILCKLALFTLLPDSSTSWSSATGVSFPVLPTCQVTPFNTVETWCAGNLYAIAHLGVLLV